MDELLDEISAMTKGGLLTKDESVLAIRLLVREITAKSIFTNTELVKIYLDVKARINFAPEENTEYEVCLAKAITDKIEKVLS